jgi:hypothetical protein
MNGPPPQQTGDEPSGHTHTDADKLVWVKKDIDANGFRITLGHHGDHFHFGDTIEPAVMITKDGEIIADAEIQNCLISNDSTTVTEKIPLVFETETSDEPAHYAQGNLKIPADQGPVQILFTIKLPGEDASREFQIDVHAH